MREVVEIQDICNIHYGKSLREEERIQTGNWPVYGSNGQVGFHNSALIEKPTIIIGRKGSVGEIIYSPSGGWTIDTAFYVDLLESNKVDLRYLFYALKRARLGRHVITTSIPGLSRDKIYQTKIPLPPLPEQKRIAAILDKADEIRRKREESIRLCDEFLKSVFLEMFGDPVTNPKGWEETKLSELFKVPARIGSIVPASDVGDFIVVRVGELGGIYPDLSKSKRIYLSKEDQARFAVKYGDILLARAIGSEEHLGKSSIFEESRDDVVFDSHVMRLRFNDEFIRPLFFLYMFKTEQGKLRILKRGGRTAVQYNVNSTQLSEITIPVPSLEVQDRFIAICCRQFKNLQMNVISKKISDSLVMSLSNSYI